jgi:molybdopterin converting factor subunit 1
MRVLFFAQLKDATGCSSTEFVSQSPLNSDQLWSILLHEFPHLQGHRDHVRLACNWEYARPETLYGDRDEVALIPPVSGG